MALFFFSWTFSMCGLTFPLCLNNLPHTPHANGFSSVWQRLCVCQAVSDILSCGFGPSGLLSQAWRQQGHLLGDSRPVKPIYRKYHIAVEHQLAPK